MAIGCAGTDTQRGITITGSRCTSERIISNDRLPAPMTIEARSSIVGMPDARSTSPTRCRLRMWADEPPPPSCVGSPFASPPR